MDNLQTGDLILFNYKGNNCSGFLSKLIKWGTNSKFTHIGMVLKNPKFDNIPQLEGIYVWESGYEGYKDPQDGKIKLGVQITPLEEILDSYKDKGSVYIRKLENVDRNKIFSKENINKIHNIVYDKPYDLVPEDWIEAYFKKDSSPKKTNRFWCSALVGYIYSELGILEKNTDWSILIPCDFSQEKERLVFKNDYKLGNSIKVEY